MSPGIIKGIAVGIGLGLVNFILAIITVRISLKTQQFIKSVGISAISMIVRLTLLLVVLYLITRSGSFHFMSVIISFVGAYIVFMAIEVYYMVLVARARSKGKE